MKIDWKKAIGLTAAVSMLVPLAACGGSSDGGDKNASGSTEAVTLSVWAPQEDQAKDTNWLGKVEENFAKAHPEYNITWKNDVVSEGDASKQVSTDPSAAADVYMFASDQLGVLMDAKAIGQLLDHLHAVDGRLEGMCGALTRLGSDYAAKDLPELREFAEQHEHRLAASTPTVKCIEATGHNHPKPDGVIFEFCSRRQDQEERREVVLQTTEIGNAVLG